MRIDREILYIDMIMHACEKSKFQNKVCNRLSFCENQEIVGRYVGRQVGR